jgi:acetylornithine/N-succinyldiaminopimelate aminotransferase
MLRQLHRCRFYFVNFSDMSDYLMATYGRLPVTFERGEGAWLWDKAGQRYLDALSGIAVCNLGHAHPAVTQAICEQAQQLGHTSNLYGIEVQTKLAKRLCHIAGMETAFFCNSGAEANEAAIKLARLYGHKQGIENPTIVVMENSFHGRTLATLTATGNRKVQAGFEPLVPGFTRAPFSDLQALETIAKNSHEVVAILLEPIQGEGGVRVPDAGYLSKVRRFCNKQGWLMMLDEVQSGMGRTGRWFNYQHEKLVPDVVCVAKALGNGFPLGACLAQGEAARVFSPGTHGSTFGGNPMACRAGLAVIDAIEHGGLCEQASKHGHALLSAFRERLKGVNGVKDIRGKGLMIGIELETPCAEVVHQALARRLLINVTEGNVIRLLPPLIITEQQADSILDIVSELIVHFLKRGDQIN